MRKSLFFAAAAGLTLVSAHPPQVQEARESKTGYPPCSRTVTDRCIQLNERAARAPANLARNAGTAQAAGSVRPAEDIDVTYAGDLRPSASSSAQAPAQAQAPARAQVQAQGEAVPAAAPARPARAHAVRAETLRQASYPVCRAGVSDRCQQQQRTRTSERRLSLRVKRAGERG